MHQRIPTINSHTQLTSNISKTHKVSKESQNDFTLTLL